MVGQREGVENPDLLDGVATGPVEPDVAGERGGLAADVDHPGHRGRREQVDHLAAGSGARRVQHRDVGTAAGRAQGAAHRIGEDLDLRQVGQGRAGRP